MHVSLLTQRLKAPNTRRDLPPLPPAQAPRAASASAPAHAIPAEREAQLQSLRFLKGDWDCFNDGAPEGSPPLAVSRVREQPGGWFKTVTRVTQGARNGTFCSCMTFDANKNKFVESNYLDNGDYGTSESAGWEGDTLLLKGRRNSQNGQHADYQKAYIKMDDNTFAVVAHARREDGAFHVENRGICRRNPGLPPDDVW